MSPEKNGNHERCELSFIWGKVRTIAQETVFQRVLRNCSKVGWEVSTYVILVNGGVGAIKPMFFCRRLLKLTDASIHQLLNSYCLPGSWLTIKIYFHYFYERTGYADTVDLSLPFMLLSPLHSLHILLISRMLDEKKVWTAVFSYKVFWPPISTCSEMLILKVLFSRSRLDLKNQKFWEVVLAFWAGLSGDIELWTKPRSTESLGNEASALLDGERFCYVWRNSAKQVKWPAKGHRIS